MKLRCIALLASLLSVASCVTPGALQPGAGTGAGPGLKSVWTAEGSHTFSFKAKAFIFQAAPAPVVTEKTFDSVAEVNVSEGVISYSFENKFQDEKENTRAVVAISGRSAGFAIYNSLNQSLAEYPKGKAAGTAAFFTEKTANGTTYIKWLFGDSGAVSVVDSYTQDGQPVLSEVAVYQLVQ